MGIERIEIEGFRSLKHVEWEPSNLNVLIGPNGSGKSNVLRALELLSFAARGRRGEAIDGSRGIYALAWNHTCETLDWKLRLACDEQQQAHIPLDTEDLEHISYQLMLEATPEHRDFFVSQEGLRCSRGSETRELLKRDANKAMVFDDFGTGISFDRIRPQQALLPSTGSIASEPHYRAEAAIAGWVCYQDMRVDRDASLRGSAQARRMDVVQSDGQNLVSVLHTHYAKNLGFRSAIDDAMRAAFGDDYAELSFPPAEDTRVQLRLRWQSLSEPQSAADLSDGILRFLLLLAILSQPNPPPLVAIDEPETGLHPRMQHIIAEYAVEASRKTQVILTTHSPEFLDAFRDTIPKVTVAFWEDGQTVLKSPPEDVLKHWLKQYTLGSLMSSGELEGEAE